LPDAKGGGVGPVLWSPRVERKAFFKPGREKEACAIFETVDLKEVQKYFGKQIQTAFKKNLQTLLKTTGWRSLSILHLSSNRQPVVFKRVCRFFLNAV
jgi:hypothetical protein